MDESLWELFWTTGLPEAYALAKGAGHAETDRPGGGSPDAPPETRAT